MNDDLDAIRRVLAADVESFRRVVERYQRPLLTRRKAAKVDVGGKDTHTPHSAKAPGGWDRPVARCRVRTMVCDAVRRPGAEVAMHVLRPLSCGPCPAAPAT